MKYTYPAILQKDAEGRLVTFPDFPECITHGSTIPEAIKMAEDVLCLHLYNLEERNEDIAPPSAVEDIPLDPTSTVHLISCDTEDYRRFYNR